MITEVLKNGCERLGNVFLNGFDESKNCPIKPAHFIPCNRWKEDAQWPYTYIVDASTGDRYLNEDSKTKRLKCLALTGATPIVHAISLVLNLANRVGKVVSFAHFWHSEPNKKYSFTDRFISFCKDLLIIALTPIFYLGLLFSAIYGLISPNDGRKLYASFERAAFGRDVLAPCFQPEPTSHFFGGNIHAKNAW